MPFLRFFSFLMITAGMCIAVENPVWAGEQPARTSVIELWYIPLGKVPQQPDVAILSDGAVWTNNGIHHQLTQLELENLVKALLHDDKLEEIETTDLVDEIRDESLRTELSWRIPNAADSLIRIRTAGKTYEVRCHAVGVLGTRFPSCKCLQCFAAAQRRLENIRAVTEVGGTEEAARLAVLAQAQLEFEFGLELPITPEDLSMVRAMPDGSRFAQFLVRDSQAGAESHIVSVFQSPGATPRVSFQSGATIVR